MTALSARDLNERAAIRTAQPPRIQKVDNKPDMTADTLIKQGQNEFYTGNLESALSTFEQAKQLSPQHYQAWLFSGFTCLSLGHFEDALHNLQTALPLKPTDPAVHDYLGRCWIALGDDDKALFHFRESARLRPPAVAADDDVLKVPAFRFRHDLEQMTALDEKQKLDENARACLAAFRAVWQTSDSTAPAISVDRQSDHFKPLSLFYRTRVHLEPASKVIGGALNPDLDSEALTASYLNKNPQILVIDDFLSPDALQGLRDYCTYSTIWHQDRPSGYLASTLPENFACPLLFQISNELTQLLPGVIKSHRLAYAWGFKYDSALSGVPVHADDAVVNVNFWMTSDDANRSPNTGGLIIWDKKPPAQWNYDAYNNATNTDAIRDFLQQEGAKGIRIPHRANRVVIFDSDLFHETDEIDFKDDYLSRRVNMTLLYGTCRASR